MKMILKLTILAVLLLSGQPAANAGPSPKTWELGKLISVNREVHMRTGGVFLPGGQGGIGTRRDVSYILSVEIQMKTGAHIVDGLFEPRQAPKVIENDAIQYRIDHEKLFLLDTDGKELKLKIIKIRKP